MQKTAEASDDLIGNKIADKIKMVSKTSPQNILETVPRETKKYSQQKDVYPQKKRQRLIDELRLI